MIATIRKRGATFAASFTAAIYMALLFAPGCSSNEAMRADAGRQYAREALLTGDGRLHPAGRMDPSLQDAAASLTALVKRYASTHSAETSSDGVSVVLCPRYPFDNPLESQVIFLPDWRVPDNAITRKANTAWLYHNSAVYKVKCPEGGYEFRFIRFMPEVEEWPIENLSVVSVGPKDRWIGWDGSHVLLGTVGHRDLHVQKRVTLPSGARLRDYYPREDVCWLFQGDLIVLSATQNIDLGNNKTRIRSLGFVIDWNSGEVTPSLEHFDPLASLGNDRAIGLRSGRDVDSLAEGCWVVRFDENKQAHWVGKGLAIPAGDVLVSVSPTGAMGLVREHSYIFRLPSAPAPIRVRRIGDWTSGQTLPNLPSDAYPAGWLSLETAE